MKTIHRTPEAASKAWSDFLIGDHRIPLWLRISIAGWRGATTFGREVGHQQEMAFFTPGSLAVLVGTTGKAVEPAIRRAVTSGFLADGSDATCLLIPPKPTTATVKAEVQR